MTVQPHIWQDATSQQFRPAFSELIDPPAHLKPSTENTDFTNEILDALYTGVLEQIFPAQLASYINHEATPQVSLTGFINESTAIDQQQALSHYLKSPEQLSLSPADRRAEAINLKQRYTKLQAVYGSEHRVLQFYMHAVAQLAQMLAYCYLNRIRHQNLNEDTLTLSGVWQQNEYLDFEQYNDEDASLITLFTRSLCYFNSFNNTNLSSPALAEFFTNAYAAHKRRFVCELIGNQHLLLSAPMHSELSQMCVDEVASKYKELSSLANKSKVTAEALNEKLLHFLLGAFCEPKPYSALAELIHLAHDISESHLTLSSHNLNSAIKSLRKVCFTPMFSRHNVHRHIKFRHLQQDEHKVGEIIENYQTSAAWLYGRMDTKIHTMLFFNSIFQCYYIPITQSFVIEHFIKGHKYTFINVKELLVYLRSLAKSDCNLPGCLGWDPLFVLIQALLQIQYSWNNQKP